MNSYFDESDLKSFLQFLVDNKNELSHRNISIIVSFFFFDDTLERVGIYGIDLIFLKMIGSGGITHNYKAKLASKILKRMEDKERVRKLLGYDDEF